VHLENAAGWQVRNNHLYGVGLHGVYANRVFGSSVADNYIEDFGSRADMLVPVSSFYGIYASVQSGASSIISGNKVLQLHGRPAGPCSFSFIHVKLNGGTGVINVVNNAIRGATGNSKATLMGLDYANSVASGTLLLLSASNNVQQVDVDRHLAGNVTLVSGM